MHPTDQVVAFTTLADAGLSVAAIAARFGLAERLVEQRLHLGNVAPHLLDAYRAHEIDLEVLKAFAVTTDHERQMTVWQQISDQGYRPSAWQVKRMLTEERVPGSAAIAKFVGVEAYEAAGGKVLRDLFSRDDDSAVWFDEGGAGSGAFVPTFPARTDGRPCATALPSGTNCGQGGSADYEIRIRFDYNFFC